MIRSLLAVLVAATAILSAGSAWAASAELFKWTNGVSIQEQTLAPNTSRYTAPLALPGDANLSKVIGVWSGADSVSVTIEVSADQTTWYEVWDLPLVSDDSDGAYGMYVGGGGWRSLAAHNRQRSAFWKRSANWVRLLVTNDDNLTQVTRLTLWRTAADGPDPFGPVGPADPIHSNWPGPPQ